MTFISNPDFSQYEVISRPCADREARVFTTTEGAPYERSGTCYRAYSLALAKESYGNSLVLLIEHGGGREALRIRNVYGDEADWLLCITDERRLYAALWSLYGTAQLARDSAAQATVTKYCAAFAEGRLKKRRRNRRVYVEIEAPAMPALCDVGA